jgi:sugar phosphate isomerase/epimerase
MTEMRLGLGTYAFTWAIGVPGHGPERPMSPLDFLREARRLGLKLVQICDNLPLTRMSTAELAEFERFAGDSGITIELGTRGIEESHLRTSLDLAVRLRSPILRVVVDSPGDEPEPGEVVRRLKRLMPAFSEAGVKLAIENHDRFTSHVLTSIIRQIGTEQAGICLDTVNSFGALEGPGSVVPELAPYVFSVHVKDFTVRRPEHQMGFILEGCAAGCGRQDIPWVFSQIAGATDYSPSAILETWVSPGATLSETIAREREWTEQGLVHLRGLLAPRSGAPPTEIPMGASARVASV